MERSTPPSVVGTNRISYADSLIDPTGIPQEVVERENFRIHLMTHEPGQPKGTLMTAVHGLLTKIGIRKPEASNPDHKELKNAAVEQQTDYINSLLDQSRESIRAGSVFGVDDVEVDTYLGVRAEQSLLPAIFRGWHQRSEQQLGHDVTFLDWMANHATNEQLMNVWQWHDHYLEQQDNNPEFQEKIAALKADYLRGNTAAIEAGILHPSMRVTRETLDEIAVKHGSPLSAYTPTTRARADKKTGTITMGVRIDDQTFFHEMTHIPNGGFITILDEGATDILAAETYNAAYPERKPYKLHDVYSAQRDIHAFTYDMTNREPSTYELSRLYAGDDPAINTARLTHPVDKELGLPILSYALLRANDTQVVTNFSEVSARNAVENQLRSWLGVIKDLYFDEHGQRYADTTIPALMKRLVSEDMDRRHGKNACASAGSILFDAIQDRALLQIS